MGSFACADMHRTSETHVRKGILKVFYPTNLKIRRNEERKLKSYYGIENEYLIDVSPLTSKCPRSLRSWKEFIRPCGQREIDMRDKEWSLVKIHRNIVLTPFP